VGNQATATLQVKAVSVKKLVLTPSTAKGGTNIQCTVTIDAPLASNLVLTLNPGTNPGLFSQPVGTITILAGQTQGSKTLFTNKVSRTLSTQVSTTYGGKTVSALLTLTR